MGLFGRDKSGVTNADRLRVLELATDEDYTLYEVLERFTGDIEQARRAADDLLKKGLIEVHVHHPDRRRETVPEARTSALLADDRVWQKHESGQPKFIVAATDSGWRWHQKNWKPS